MRKQSLTIVKIGGNIIDDTIVLQQFLQSFAQIKGPKILVHGGGKLATKWAERMNIPVQMIDGRRVTDAETLDLITMIYAGKINKNIVAQLQANGCNAVGFSGADGNTIIAKKRPVAPIDFGFVGDIIKVESTIIKKLLISDVTISFCAISHDQQGQLLNTNADTIASELAIALSKDYEVKLYYCFEKKGVLKDVENPDSVLEDINAEIYKNLKSSGTISEGMIPKLDNCFYALENGVKQIKIGKFEMLFTNNSKHTTIRK